MGRKPARADDGSEGSGNGKKRMPVCNGLDRGSNFASTRKGADLPTVFHCMNGGKLVNVRYSTTPKSERLTDMKPKIQWKDIDWKKVFQNVNRLQTRITKAVAIKLLTAARYKKGYERIEPYVVKVASPVLRRGRASNRFFLFGGN